MSVPTPTETFNRAKEVDAERAELLQLRNYLEDNYALRLSADINEKFTLSPSSQAYLEDALNSANEDFKIKVQDRLDVLEASMATIEIDFTPPEGFSTDPVDSEGP